MELKQYLYYEESEILELYKSVGWSNYYENPELLKEAYKNSLFIVGAYSDDKLIGIIRVVGDGCSIIYVQDIIVAPAYQRKGTVNGCWIRSWKSMRMFIRKSF